MGMLVAYNMSAVKKVISAKNFWNVVVNVLSTTIVKVVFVDVTKII